MYALQIPNTIKGLLLLLGLLVINTSPVLALSSEQRRVYDSNVHYFDIEPQIVSSSCGSSALVGSDNAEKIWNFFIGQGLTPPQVAGLMGNLQAESGFNPRRVQSTPTPEGDADYPTDGVGFGLAQWTYSSRQQPLVELAESRGVIPGDLSVQLDYIMQEFQGGWNDVYIDLKATDNVDTASDIIMVRYEGPEDQSEAAKEERRVLSRNLLAQFGSSSPTNTSSSGSTTSCAVNSRGEVIGGYSLPVDRHWYDQYPERFSAPHHDYPAADISLPSGTAIYSMSAGTVISAPVGGNCGNGVIIDAGNGIVFKYCHGLDGGSVSGAKPGDTVQPGQYIMGSGNTGESTGPHLHLEIIVNGQGRCPQTMFEGIANGAPPDPAALPATGCTYNS